MIWLLCASCVRWEKTYHDGLAEGDAIEALVVALDLVHVHLMARNHDPDQVFVPGPRTLTKKHRRKGVKKEGKRIMLLLSLKYFDQVLYVNPSDFFTDEHIPFLFL